MNKKMIRIAGWALGLSMAVAGIGAAIGTSHIVSGNAPTMVKAESSQKSDSWDLTSEDSDFYTSGCSTYFTQPYGMKAANAYIANKTISDFSTPGTTSIRVGIKCLQNGSTDNRMTIWLIDSNGNTLGDGVVVTPPNATAASKTSFVYATFSSAAQLTGAYGFKAQLTTKSVNTLVNGASYEVTYDVPDTPSITVQPENVAICTADQIGKTASVVPAGFGDGTLYYSWSTEDSNISLVNENTAVVTILPNSNVGGSATVSVSVWGGNVAEADALTETLDVTLTTPKTVAEALELSGQNNIYTKGIVSQIDSISTKYGNATYYISDDGTTSNQLEIFRGKYLNDQSFTSEDQLQLGDRVVVYGNIVTYNDIVEYDQGNYLVSLVSEPRLSLSANEITVTLGTEQTITATPANFASGAVTYSFDEDSCASLSFEGNTITVHGDAVGSHTFTVTGLAGGVAQTTAELTVNVVQPYPSQISRSGYASFTDTQTFAEGTGSVTITYSDGSKATKHLGDAGVKLLISDVEVSADTSTANYVGANSAKITYTEGGHTVETDKFTLNVNAELAVTSFEGVPEYLIIDSEDPAHSATVTVNYKSLNGAPELSVVSSNPAKLPVTFDEDDNVYDANSKTGVATFGIAAGSTAGQYSVTVSATYGNRTESKSFSINVRGEAPAPATGEYQKITSLSDLTTGDYVIAAKAGSSYHGMTKTVSNSKFASAAVTVTDNVIASSDGSDFQYHVSFSGSGSTRTVTIYDSNSETYACYSGSSTNVGLNANSYNWTVSVGSNGSWRLDSATASRALAFKSDTAVFGGYSTSNIKGTDYYDLEFFKYVEAAASSFDLVNEFVTNFMHMNDVSIGNGSDTGACKGDSGYYLTAKRAWNALVKGYEGEDDLEAVFSTSFEDAYARYNAWAVAMNDAAPFDGKDDVVSFIRNALVNRALDASTSLPLVVTVAALGTAAAAGFFFFFFFQRKRKEF